MEDISIEENHESASENLEIEDDSAHSTVGSEDEAFVQENQSYAAMMSSLKVRS